MTEAESFEKMIKDQFPDAEITIDPAQQKNGSTFIDVRCNGKHTAIEMRGPDFGYGVHYGEVVYGGNPTEVFDSIQEAVDCVAEVFEGKKV